MKHHKATSWIALLVVLASGCTPVASAGPGGSPQPALESAEPAEVPDVAGLWTGFISVEGQRVNGTLDLGQEGGDLVAVFDAPEFGLVAEGTGSITAGGEIVLRLTYDLQCPGTADLTGRRSTDGAVIDGALTAADCTGSSEGSFSLRR